ncbi:MAG: hypothetical protein MZW92_67400 [Comamonadaceae bacterium]|nr:hypothetical protein [Comamonadaceae bacterium]
MNPENPAADPGVVEHRPVKNFKTALWAALIFAICGMLVLGGIKGRETYIKGRAVYENVVRLQQQVVIANDPGDLDAMYPLLLALKSDLSSFREEVQPLEWLSPSLRWIPMYGERHRACARIARDSRTPGQRLRYRLPGFQTAPE